MNLSYNLLKYESFLKYKLFNIKTNNLFYYFQEALNINNIKYLIYLYKDKIYIYLPYSKKEKLEKLINKLIYMFFPIKYEYILEYMYTSCFINNKHLSLIDNCIIRGIE